MWQIPANRIIVTLEQVSKLKGNTYFMNVYVLMGLN